MDVGDCRRSDPRADLMNCIMSLVASPGVDPAAREVIPIDTSFSGSSDFQVQKGSGNDQVPDLIVDECAQEDDARS